MAFGLKRFLKRRLFGLLKSADLSHTVDVTFYGEMMFDSDVGSCLGKMILLRSFFIRSFQLNDYVEIP